MPSVDSMASLDQYDARLPRSDVTPDATTHGGPGLPLERLPEAEAQFCGDLGGIAGLSVMCGPVPSTICAKYAPGDVGPRAKGEKVFRFALVRPAGGTG